MCLKLIVLKNIFYSVRLVFVKIKLNRSPRTNWNCCFASVVNSNQFSGLKLLKTTSRLVHCSSLLCGTAPRNSRYSIRDKVKILSCRIEAGASRFARINALIHFENNSSIFPLERPLLELGLRCSFG